MPASSGSPNARVVGPVIENDQDFERWLEQAVGGGTKGRKRASKALPSKPGEASGPAKKRHAPNHATNSAPYQARRHFDIDARSSEENAQRLMTFRGQVQAIGYDKLSRFTFPSMPTPESIRVQFAQHGQPVHIRMHNRVICDSVMQFIFDKIYDAKRCSNYATHDQVIAHLREMPADELLKIGSWYDIALSLAKADKSTTYVVIRNAMSKQLECDPNQQSIDEDLNPRRVFRPGQPLTPAALSAMLKPATD